ncbi:MFS transporter [Burkholderia aenigmatica]|uniref:MFS transporter n=1 Tax=Burkholderia aenigmatica TaxID=2015348 RepID=A0ABY6Y3Z2_9BURK|nr:MULTISPECIES: MFS transporter [Burkholderia]MCA8293380.1 MFS transporter [Burkholderia sp. AU30198]UKD16472.1 MFS transporter [Burkholderia aenigmatica]VWD12481.1 MFS transporter [Burkholderia aenigmatica]VWD45199.1 MFS transporter [Burkholderia aenigmatica]
MAPHPQSGADLRRTILATTVGNALEYFDFTVYGFLALIIGKLFFPSFDAAGQLLLAVGTFGAGFVMRPLGGVVIGAYADRAGRKPAMVLTIFLMALGCGMIAVLPTYAEIGVAAPILIVVARSIQGFSAGGEFGASTTLLVEQARPHTRGYMASWQFASQGLGVLAAALTVAILSSALTPDALERWGWRVPFALGMLIAPVGAYIRRRLEETHTGESARPAPGRVRSNGRVATLCREHGRAVVVAIMITMGGTGASYVVSFYMPTYAIREFGMSPAVALSAAALTGALAFGCAPLVGRWSDRVGRKPLIVAGRIALVLLIYPAFAWLKASPTPAVLFTVVGLLTVVLAIQAVPSITILPEMFPESVRATGMSLVYSVGVAIFGGFAPFISTWLVNASGNKVAPAWYLIVVALVSMAGLPYLRDRTGETIDTPAVSGASSYSKV